MKITDALLGEHGVLYAQFDQFESSADQGDLDCVQRRAALLAAALQTHALLEDELLFDPLDARDADLAGLLSVMREEHVEIETALHEIQQTANPARARRLLRDLIDAARRHFEKEELVVFPLAESRLHAPALTQLGELWAQRRGVRLHSSSSTSAPV